MGISPTTADAPLVCNGDTLGTNFVADAEDEGRPQRLWGQIEKAPQAAPVMSISFSDESGICSLAQTRVHALVGRCDFVGNVYTC
jgi:hypothetical protein